MLNYFVLEFNKNLIDVIVNNSSTKYITNLITAVFQYIETHYGGDIDKMNVLNILVGDSLIEKDDISLPYIINHKKELFYNGDSIDDNTMEVRNVDNISCITTITYKTLDGTICDYNLSWIANPNIVNR